MGNTLNTYRTVTALIASGVVIAALAACSSTAPEETHTPEAAASPTAVTEPTDCTAEQLSGSFTMNPVVNIELRNTSETPCIIRGGYPTVVAVDSDGAPLLPEATQQDEWKVGVQDVTVEPGESAWAVFAFGYTNQVANARVLDIGGFSVTLPETDTVVFLTYAGGIWVSPDSDNSLIVRPISAEREDTSIG